MSVQQVYLDFYGRVRLHLAGPRHTVEFVRSEWNAFTVAQPTSPPDLQVQIQPWNTEQESGQERSNVAFPRSLRGCYKGYQWKAIVNDRNSGTTAIEYSAMPRSNLLLKDSVLEPLVMNQLEKGGLFGFHASAARLGGKAWMICGPSKSGKTAMALVGHRNGRTILSDDTALLGEGELYPYPTPPRVYIRTLGRSRLLDGFLPGNVLARLVLNGMIGLATIGQIRIPTRLTSARLSESTRDTLGPIPLGGLILLRVGDGTPSVKVGINDASIGDALASHRSEHASSFLHSMMGVFANNPRREEFVERLLDSTARANRCICVTLRRSMLVEEWDALFLRIERTIDNIEAEVN